MATVSRHGQVLWLGGVGGRDERGLTGSRRAVSALIEARGAWTEDYTYSLHVCRARLARTNIGDVKLVEGNSE